MPGIAIDARQMIRTTKSALLFPTWRDHWSDREGISDLLQEADQRLRRRAKGNHKLPKLGNLREPEGYRLGLVALRAWATGSPPQDDRRPEIVRLIYQAVAPVLTKVVWPRWLYLERAFLDASGTGDLLFAALILRTMCEEMKCLHAIDLTADQVFDLACSPSESGRKCLDEFLSIAWTYLDRLPNEMVLTGSGWPEPASSKKSNPELERARAALNSYVHPNYGSHITALYPERSEGSRVLLEAIVKLYDAFFALSWAEAPLQGGSQPLGIEPLSTWRKAAQRIKTVTVPELRRGLTDPALAKLPFGEATLEWIFEVREDHDRLLAEPELAPLLAELPRNLGPEALKGQALLCALWDGAKAINILDWSIARRAEQKLSTDFASGAPEPEQQVDWLRFTAQSLQLAISLDRVKSGAFKAQLVRQIAEGNSVGVWLCLRSLIEHLALVTWLPEQLGKSLDVFAANAQAGCKLPEIAKEVEKPLAQFLASQSRITSEDRRSWVMTQDGNTRSLRLKLREIVTLAFGEEAHFHSLYDQGSAVLHGRMVRGIDLMFNAKSQRQNANTIGLLVLERLCDRDVVLSPHVQALIQSAQLDHAANLGGPTQAESDRVAKQMLGDLSDELEAGTDFVGQGTKESPFTIGEHLAFHKAEYTLLRQFGLDPTQIHRELARDNDGHFFNRWITPERDYWFIVRGLC